jgi:hypothetical protein
VAVSMEAARKPDTLGGGIVGLEGPPDGPGRPAASTVVRGPGPVPPAGHRGNLIRPLIFAPGGGPA